MIRDSLATEVDNASNIPIRASGSIRRSRRLSSESSLMTTSPNTNINSSGNSRRKSNRRLSNLSSSQSAKKKPYEAEEFSQDIPHVWIREENDAHRLISLGDHLFVPHTRGNRLDSFALKSTLSTFEHEYEYEVDNDNDRFDALVSTNNHSPQRIYDRQGSSNDNEEVENSSLLGDSGYTDTSEIATSSWASNIHSANNPNDRQMTAFVDSQEQHVTNRRFLFIVSLASLIAFLCRYTSLVSIRANVNKPQFIPTASKPTSILESLSPKLSYLIHVSELNDTLSTISSRLDLLEVESNQLRQKFIQLQDLTKLEKVTKPQDHLPILSEINALYDVTVQGYHEFFSILNDSVNPSICNCNINQIEESPRMSEIELRSIIRNSSILKLEINQYIEELMK